MATQFERFYENCKSAEKFSELKKLERCSNLVDRLRLDRITNLTCDVVFVVENEKFNAHKSVMAQSSEYFRVMLTGSFSESRQREITLNNVSKEEFRIVMDHIYGVPFNFQKMEPEKCLRVSALADRLCLDSFNDEIQHFLEDLKTIRGRVQWYSLATVFGHDKAQKELKSVIFAHLVEDIYLYPAKSLNPTDDVLKEIPFELLLDTLKLLKTPEVLPEYGLQNQYVDQIRSIRFIEFRVQFLTDWIEENPGLESDKYLSLLDQIGLEDIPPSVARCMMEFTFRDGKTLSRNLLQRYFDRINQRIAELNLRATLVRVQGQNVELEDLSLRKKEWTTRVVSFMSEVDLFTSDGNIIYFLTRDNRFSRYNLDTATIIPSNFEMVLPTEFDCRNIFANEGILYAHGKHRVTKTVTIVIYNRQTSQRFRYDLKLKYNDYWCPALTISEGKLIFRNGQNIYQFDPETEGFRCLYSLRFFRNVLDQDFRLAKVGDDVYLLENGGRYLKNPSPTNNRLLLIEKPRKPLATSSSIHEIEGNAYVAIHNPLRPEAIKLFRNFDGENFEPLGFLPTINNKQWLLFGESPTLILRRDNY